MRVTDAQVHIWAEARSSRPYEAFFPLERLEQAMSSADVDRVVLVPTSWGYKDDLSGANEYNFAAAQAQPDRFAVMALLDPRHNSGPATIAELMKRPGMKGLRLGLDEGRHLAFEWLWPEATRLGIPVAINAARGDLPILERILKQNPELMVLLDHAAVPAVGPDKFADIGKVAALAKYKNLVVKASAMTRYAREAYPFRDLHEHIRCLYDAFGPQRLAWGSDYSTHAARATYREVVDLFRVACDFFTEEDREWIMDRTMSRVLRWDD